MSDEGFGNDFMWYEWGFVAPEDLPREDLEVIDDSTEFRYRSQPSCVQEPSDVWYKHR